MWESCGLRWAQGAPCLSAQSWSLVLLILILWVTSFREAWMTHGSKSYLKTWLVSQSEKDVGTEGSLFFLTTQIKPVRGITSTWLNLFTTMCFHVDISQNLTFIYTCRDESLLSVDDPDGRCSCFFNSLHKSLAWCLVLRIGTVPNLPWSQFKFFDLQWCRSDMHSLETS